MSGIAGIYRFDSQSVARRALETMVESLSHRGPDGNDCWRDGCIGLGHQKLYTTRESSEETLPLVSRDGQKLLVSDARIDNREELTRTLSLTRSSGRGPTDSELILAAYERWGRRCPEHLLGVFSFAIWDHSHRRLFGARDCFGIKPFYYHYTRGRLFAFGSEIKALLRLPDVSEAANEIRIADYIAGICADREYTFYRQIRRLPPGHSITVRPSKLQIRSYWQLELSDELQLSSSRDYAEAFKEIFADAVDCRLRRTPRAGAFLSGGLDSASIVSIARQICSGSTDRALPTFSATFDSVPACDERSYIEDVLDRGGLRPHFVAINRYNPVRELPDVVAALDEPMVGNLFNLTWRLGDTIQKQKIRVVLDGHGGDEVLSHGHGWFQELARDGRWVKLFQELRGVRHRLSRPELLLYYWLSYGLLPRPVSRRLWRLMQSSNSRGDSGQTRECDWTALLREDVIRRTDLEDRVAAHRQRFGSGSTERECHLHALETPLQVRALEELDHKSAAYGIESAFPYWDRRLVEFCLALPSAQKRSNGVGRMVLRRAMKDILPNRIRERTDKTVFTPSVTTALEEHWPDVAACMNDLEPHLQPYVDRPTLRQLVPVEQPEGHDLSPEDVHMIGKMLMLGLWIKMST